MLLEVSGEITPERMEGWSQSKNSPQLWKGLVMEGHKIKTLTPWKESYDQPRQHIEKQRHHFAD